MAKDNEATQIHAIVLTSNRPESLSRCVATAINSLGARDLLTILDDSPRQTSVVNSEIIGNAAKDADSSICHLRTSELWSAITANSGQDCEWLSKTAHRDIAPLRNIELLLSKVVAGRTTILIDDDIHSFDLNSTHQFMEINDTGPNGVIAGATICGMSELDTLTRLSDALTVLEANPAVTAESVVFRALRTDDTAAVRYVSAGYMAFRFTDSVTFAFPPGYNEDWLWCLLHKNTAEVLREDQRVMHDPPSIRCSTRDDLCFELSGDLIFDCLSEYDGEDSALMETLLSTIQNHTPLTSLMPTTRVHELLEQYDQLATRERVSGFWVIERNGLSVARDMIRSGELELDGRELLRAWCQDTLAKQRSFASTMNNPNVISSIRQFVHTGVLKWNLA